MQYIPWMQASYIMAANKEALQYLPDGADIDALTYDQLIEWAANVHEATGEPKFGFPAGPNGLKHRFFQGYLYPSYTNGVVRTFASDEAVIAWEKFRELWAHTNPASTNFSFMQEQLLSGDAWIVFDHTSRLAQAFNERPGRFRGLPGACRSDRARLHAGSGWGCHSAHRAGHGCGQGTCGVHAARLKPRSRHCGRPTSSRSSMSSFPMICRRRCRQPAPRSPR